MSTLSIICLAPFIASAVNRKNELDLYKNFSYGILVLFLVKPTLFILMNIVFLASSLYHAIDSRSYRETSFTQTLKETARKAPGIFISKFNNMFLNYERPRERVFSNFAPGATQQPRFTQGYFNSLARICNNMSNRLHKFSTDYDDLSGHIKDQLKNQTNLICPILLEPMTLPVSIDDRYTRSDLSSSSLNVGNSLAADFSCWERHLLAQTNSGRRYTHPISGAHIPNLTPESFENHVLESYPKLVEGLNRQIEAFANNNGLRLR